MGKVLAATLEEWMSITISNNLQTMETMFEAIFASDFGLEMGS